MKYIDLAKTIGIFAMIIGHSDIPDCIRIVIYAFHMPLYFFLTGFFLQTKSDSIGKVADKKRKALLIPYVFMVLSIIIVSFLVSFLTMFKDYEMEFLKNGFIILKPE